MSQSRLRTLAIILLMPLLALAAGAVSAESSGAVPADITLEVSTISLTERDGPTQVSVTAHLRQVRSQPTEVVLGFHSGPLLTPGVARGAIRGEDYSASFTGGRTITVARGSLSGKTTFTIDPVLDPVLEGDEAVILIGATRDRAIAAPVDLIIEDGPYLSFPESISGRLHYPDEPIAISIDDALNAYDADGFVRYRLTAVEPRSNPLGLIFRPSTRSLIGNAPAASQVPHSGLTTRYTITARDNSGHEATTLISVAVVQDVCSSTAASWFHSDDQPSPALVRDCNVLLAAKDTLRGSSDALNWSRDTPLDTPWHGIKLDRNRQRIQAIELQLRSLNGTIPPLLGHLSGDALRELILGGDWRRTHALLENKLTGPIPRELGLLPDLTVLALSYNNLSGPIPPELANNGRLHYLYLADTDKPPGGAMGPAPSGISGSIPAEFGDLPLRALNILGNPGLDGHLPWQLGKNVSSGDSPGLQVLNLSGNSLTGSIPWQLGRFGKIQQLALSGNRFSGEIPWQLGDLGNQEADLERREVALYLGQNELIGAVPPELGQISNLTVMSLGQNSLSGAIPASLGALSKLRVLSLHTNRLSGEIPAELGQLSSLQTLSVSCNELSGAVPAGIGAIATLTELKLYGNAALAPATEENSSIQPPGLQPTWSGECEPREPVAAIIAEPLAVVIDTRVAVRHLADGRTEYALQRLDEHGEWSQRILPERRFLPADSAVNRWLDSSPLTVLPLKSAGTITPVGLRIAAQRLASGRIELALRRLGEHGEWSEPILPARRFVPADPAINRWLVSTPVVDLLVLPLGPDQ